MPVVPATSQSIRRAATLLRSGGVVAFPTETVYGLAANAFDARAVARVFEIKRRPSFDPLIVHVVDDEMLAKVVREVPARARALMERFWPGPLTLVLERSDAVPPLVTAGLASVAVRMPSHRVARELLREAGVPLAAPSANPFGALSPTRAEHVASALGESVDLVLDGGPAELGIESTILRLEPGAALLRAGALSVEEIEEAIGRIERDVEEREQPLSPGRLPQHYAPRTPLRIAAAQGVALAERARAGLLAMSRSSEGYAAVRLLSPHDDLREAAAHLFEALHELDALGLERIDAEPVREEGLGRAIADRLRRAAHR